MKIGICGSHGVGKTKIFDEIKLNLSDKFDIEGISEIPRRLTQYFTDNDLLKKNNNTFALQNIIMIYQLIEENFVKNNNRSLILSDRTLVDHLAYTLLLHNGSMSNDEMELLKLISIKYLKTYDIIFYIPIEFELVSDDVRSGDRIFQKEIDEHIKLFIKDFKYFTLTGSVNQRSTSAIKIICDKYEHIQKQ